MKTGIVTLNQNKGVVKQNYATSVNKNMNPSFKCTLHKDTVSFGSAVAPALVDMIVDKDFVQKTPMHVNSFRNSLGEVAFLYDFTADKFINVHGGMLLDEGVTLKAQDIKVFPATYYNFNGDIKTFEKSMINADDLHIYGNADFAGDVILNKDLTVLGTTQTGKDSLVLADNIKSNGPLRVNGKISSNNKLIVDSYLVTDSKSTLAAKDAVINGDAVIGGEASIGEKLEVDGSLRSNERSYISAKQAEVNGNINLLGSSSIEKVSANGDVRFSRINKLNEILLLKSTDKEKNAHRILEFREPLSKLQNKIKVGLGGMLELSIYTKDSPSDLLKKLDFYTVTNEIKDGKQVCEFGRAISPEQVAKFIEKGTIKFVKSI